MAKGNDTNAGSLCHAAEVGDRNTRHTIDRVQAVELESIDEEMKAVGEILLRFRRRGFAFFLHCSFCHWSPPDHSVCCFARDRAHWIDFTSESDTGFHRRIAGRKRARTGLVGCAYNAHSIGSLRIKDWAEHQNISFVLPSFPVKEMLLHHRFLCVIHVIRERRSRRYQLKKEMRHVSRDSQHSA